MSFPRFGIEATHRVVSVYAAAREARIAATDEDEGSVRVQHRGRVEVMIWTQRDNVLECMVLLLLFYGVVTYAVHAAGVWIERRLRMPGYGATGHAVAGGPAHA